MAKKKSSSVKVFGWYCPGCKMNHSVNCDANNNGAWKHSKEGNGDTISPDLLIRYKDLSGNSIICNSSITDGMIKYKSDTTHEYSNQTIELQKPK